MDGMVLVEPVGELQDRGGAAGALEVLLPLHGHERRGEQEADHGTEEEEGLEPIPKPDGAALRIIFVCRKEQAKWLYPLRYCPERRDAAAGGRRRNPIGQGHPAISCRGNVS